jgi:hypothetical protein
MTSSISITEPGQVLLRNVDLEGADRGPVGFRARRGYRTGD